MPAPGVTKCPFFRYIFNFLEKGDFEWTQKLSTTTITGNVNKPSKQAHFELFNELS
jgi:hypothetical protein